MVLDNIYFLIFQCIFNYMLLSPLALSENIGAPLYIKIRFGKFGWNWSIGYGEETNSLFFHGEKISPKLFNIVWFSIWLKFCGIYILVLRSIFTCTYAGYRSSLTIWGSWQIYMPRYILERYIYECFQTYTLY